MARIVVWVVADHYATNDFVISSSQEERSVAVPVKRVSFAIEESFPLENQRRDPGRIILVDAPGKPDEFVSLLSIANW